MEGPVKRILVIKWKDEITEEKKTEFHKKYLALQAVIPQINSLESGWIDAETAGYKDFESQGFSQVYIVGFNSVEDRDAYHVHPAHQAFSKEVIPAIDKLLRLDFSPGMPFPSICA